MKLQSLHDSFTAINGNMTVWRDFAFCMSNGSLSMSPHLILLPFVIQFIFQIWQNLMLPNFLFIFYYFNSHIQRLSKSGDLLDQRQQVEGQLGVNKIFNSIRPALATISCVDDRPSRTAVEHVTLLI